MQVSVEETSELSRKMTVNVPEEVIQEKMESRFSTLAREVKLDGFRPGKVPKHVVKKMFAARVREEVTGDVIQTTYFDALQEQNLRPVSQPHIVPVGLDKEGEGFQYTAEFEVFPEISLDNLEDIEIQRPVVEIQESDIDAMIEKLRDQKKEWQTAEHAAREGDRVTINFSGSVDGENFTDGKVQDYQVVIGDKQMIPGFEEQLLGLEPGANVTFKVTFPEQYGNEKLAGKDAEFEIEVLKVESPVLPEVYGEFFKAFGVEEDDLQAFREHLKESMQRELERNVHGKVKNAVMDALFENIKVTLPRTMIDQEIDYLLKPYQENAAKQNINPEDLQIPREGFEEQAKRRVALGLIMDEIVQKNEIKPDPERVRSAIEDLAQSYERPQDVINWYYSDEARLNEIEQMVLEDQAVEWLLERIKVSDEPTSYESAMKQENKQ